MGGAREGGGRAMQPHFQLLPRSVTPASIPLFFQPFLAAIVNLGTHGPRLSGRHCNQGEFSPSYILGQSHSHPPGSKRGHSYLTLSMKLAGRYRYVQ